MIYIGMIISLAPLLISFIISMISFRHTRIKTIQYLSANKNQCNFFGLTYKCSKEIAINDYIKIKSKLKLSNFQMIFSYSFFFLCASGICMVINDILFYKTIILDKHMDSQSSGFFKMIIAPIGVGGVLCQLCLMTDNDWIKGIVLKTKNHIDLSHLESNLMQNWKINTCIIIQGIAVAYSTSLFALIFFHLFVKKVVIFDYSAILAISYMLCIISAVSFLVKKSIYELAILKAFHLSE